MVTETGLSEVVVSGLNTSATGVVLDLYLDDWVSFSTRVFFFTNFIIPSFSPETTRNTLIWTEILWSFNLFER